MSDVTDGDRVKATKLLRDAAVDKLIQSTEYRHQARMVERIATLVAAERAAAVADLRARVEAVAEELRQEAHRQATTGDDPESAHAYLNAVASLRAAVTDTTGGVQ